MDVVLGQLVSTGTTNPTLIRIKDLVTGLGNQVEHMVRVRSGSVKFARKPVVPVESINWANQDAFVPDDGSFILTMPNGELYVQQASGADTFSITA